jgi:hypothetical protein
MTPNAASATPPPSKPKRTDELGARPPVDGSAGDGVAVGCGAAVAVGRGVAVATGVATVVTVVPNVKIDSLVKVAHSSFLTVLTVVASGAQTFVSVS